MTNAPATTMGQLRILIEDNRVAYEAALACVDPFGEHAIEWRKIEAERIVGYPDMFDLVEVEWANRYLALDGVWQTTSDRVRDLRKKILRERLGDDYAILIGSSKISASE